MSAYRNRSRPTGSQVETPTLKLVPGRAVLGGYQRFTVGPKTLERSRNNYAAKFGALQKTFRVAKRLGCTSLNDLGSSNGLSSFLAAQEGFQQVKALDHDTQCVSVVNRAAQHVHLPVTAQQWSFGQAVPAADVSVMLALVHWVYSCTATLGSFKAIARYVATTCRRAAIVEWVAPTDPAIKAFNHLRFNRGVQKDPYTLAAFEAGLKAHFTHVRLLLKGTPTRWLYLCTKGPTAAADFKALGTVVPRPVSKPVRRPALKASRPLVTRLSAAQAARKRRAALAQSRLAAMGVVRRR